MAETDRNKDGHKLTQVEVLLNLAMTLNNYAMLSTAIHGLIF